MKYRTVLNFISNRTAEDVYVFTNPLFWISVLFYLLFVGLSKIWLFTRMKDLHFVYFRIDKMDLKEAVKADKYITQYYERKTKLWKIDAFIKKECFRKLNNKTKTA